MKICIIYSAGDWKIFDDLSNSLKIQGHEIIDPLMIPLGDNIPDPFPK